MFTWIRTIATLQGNNPKGYIDWLIDCFQLFFSNIGSAFVLKYSGGIDCCMFVSWKYIEWVNSSSNLSKAFYTHSIISKKILAMSLKFLTKHVNFFFLIFILNYMSTLSCKLVEIHLKMNSNLLKSHYGSHPSRCVINSPLWTGF